MEQRRHNTRHAAALAAAAALGDRFCGLSTGHPQESKHSSSSATSSSGPPSSASHSPVTVKPQQSPRKTPSPANPSKMATKREMYDSFQVWALKTYGDSAKTKTVTRRKYTRILKILKGEEQTNAENSKFRFWVKAKGFRIGQPPGPSNDFKRNDHLLYIPCSKIQVGVNGKEDVTVYKKVAVVENFFDIIYGVHVEMDGRGGKHAGQKRTYKAIAEMYSFLPREAVTHFLMSCADCQKRMHLVGGGNSGGDGKGGPCSGASGNHANTTVAAEQPEELSACSELSSSPDDETELHIDYSLPITTTYLKHMRSLGYSEEDALNPDREDSEDAESEFSEDPQAQAAPPTSSQQQYDVHMEVETAEEQTVTTKETVEVSNAGPSNLPLDMRQVKKENGSVAWSLNEPLNMTKDLSNNHQDHSYERTGSPFNGCGKREASATPDNLSAGTKDEDEDDDDEDSDKIDTNKYDPERLKAFNMFVRLFVDENLDRMVPISRQPKDKIQAIIDSCARQFPEFGERARKRIRTYLKSCRRNKRTRENSNWEVGRSSHPHLTSALAEQILAAACENESQNAKRMRLGLKPIPAELDRGRASQASHTVTETETKTTALSRSPQHENILQATLRHGRPPTSAATSILNGNAAYLQASPTYSAPYRLERLVPNPSTLGNSTTQSSNNGHAPAPPPTNVPTDLSMKKNGGNVPDSPLKYSLTAGDVGSVKRLIVSYRESAAFLARSADELELILLQLPQN